MATACASVNKTILLSTLAQWHERAGRSRSTQRRLESKVLGQHTAEVLDDTVETCPNVVSHGSERLPMREGFHEIEQGQFGGELWRRALVHAVVDGLVAEEAVPKIRSERDPRRGPPRFGILAEAAVELVYPATLARFENV